MKWFSWLYLHLRYLVEHKVSLLHLGNELLPQVDAFMYHVNDRKMEHEMKRQFGIALASVMWA